MPERLTLAPGVEVPAPEDGSVLRYSGEAVQDVLDFFSLLCFAQNEWAGKPFELLPWEEEAVRQFLDGDGELLAARSWVPFYSDGLALVAYLAWMENRLNGERTAITRFTETRCELRKRGASYGSTGISNAGFTPCRGI